jgi:PIN domain nuclease of toxin-antitoxin system
MPPEGSVWEQQIRYSRGKIELNKNPQEALYKDLFVKAEKWKQ